MVNLDSSQRSAHKFNILEADDMAGQSKQRKLVLSGSVSSYGLASRNCTLWRPLMEAESLTNLHSCLVLKEPTDTNSDQHLNSPIKGTTCQNGKIHHGKSGRKQAQPQVIRQDRSPSRSIKHQRVSVLSDLDDSSDGLSDFIVSDSASETELRRPPRSMRKMNLFQVPRTPRGWRNIVLDDSEEETTHNGGDGSLHSVFQELDINAVSDKRLLAAAGALSDEETSFNRGKSHTFESPLFHTPPTSPPRPGLKSPLKSRSNIPDSPLRQNKDDFWRQDIINDWNDIYSPRKTMENEVLDLTQPPEQLELYEPVYDLSDEEPEMGKNKLFDSRKESMAIDFLAQLDEKITGGQIAKLSASTGGVKIVWSRTLCTTAGRAHVRREKIPTTQPGSTSIGTYKYHARIEMAEKVIDEDQKLFDTFAHEFCHLAVMMLSKERQQPHGKLFKEWGRKVSSEFSHMNVQVTTKHNYQIDYKYIWKCLDCDRKYKRHSKSINTDRKCCGKCKGKLQQIQPTPKTRGNAYQAFVRENYPVVRKEHPEWKMHEITSEVARMYRIKKTTAGKKKSSVPQSIKKASHKDQASSTPLSDDEYDSDCIVLQKLDESMTTLGLK